MKLESISEVYSQEPDCCSDESLCHTLTLKINDGGGGPYLVFSTSRWAVELEEIDNLVLKMKALLARVQEENIERS